ncbi:MAG: protein translocase subunit SecDF [Saprospirales bacterium]|nr:MAG: protein translocase subunit SecDF [Saprospirales bacterium]
MQGKGIIKFFLVVMIVVTLIQYMFVIPTTQVEREADRFAEAATVGIEDIDERNEQMRNVRVAFLDSMSSEEVFRIPLVKGYTYEELKARQLALGLDLRGGMSVVLQIDLEEFLLSLSNNSRDPVFRESLVAARENFTGAQTDFISVFYDEWRSRRTDGQTLVSIFSRNPSLRDQITFETTDGEMLRLIRQNADETVRLTFNRMRDRIDKFGVTQPNVSLDASRDIIIVELPGVDNPERARRFLQASAQLEFWDVYRVSDEGILDAFIQADERLKAVAGGAEVETTEQEFRVDTTITYTYDENNEILDTIISIDTLLVEAEMDLSTGERGPLLSLLELNAASGGQMIFPISVMGAADRSHKDRIMEMLTRPDIQALFPRDLAFRWSANPTRDIQTGQRTRQYQLYAIQKRRGAQTAPIEGDRVIRASSTIDPVTSQVVVNLSLDAQGARVWEEMTTRAAQDNNREIAIVLDNEVVSAPRVNEPIPSGDSRISGDFSVQDGQDLANILEIGKLPARIIIIQEAIVGPSLGQDNINRSITALISGFLLVLVFMVLYYSTGGLVAIVALFANLFFIFGALSSFGTVLTLPGIAGIVLTIGMAVDANVIIFERIREEVREGKSMLMAISDGFKNSYSAIIDANVTTILTAIVLAYFGMGPIKGFAVVLIIGVLCSLFTAVLLGRMLIEWWTISKGKNISFFTPATKNMFANPQINWLGKRKLAYIISSTIIILGIVSFATRGFELGVDFRGGYSYNVQFADNVDVTANDLREVMSGIFDDEPVVKAVDTRNTFNITTSHLIDDTSEDAADRVAALLHEGVNQIVGGGLELERFLSTDSRGTHIISSAKVGPTIADDIRRSSVYATIFALLLIFLYIFIRFNKWQYSMGAVAALFHDTLILLSVFSILHGIVPWAMEIDQAFIAALLTVIGYSINDTVVVFDRIREYLNTYVNKNKTDVINMAVNSTISRTVITSVTTFFVVFVLFIFGGGSIKGFAFALLIGIIVGTYSSVFVATPVVHDLTGEMKPREVKKKSNLARSKV